MPSVNFIDYVTLNVRSGKGGAGCRHFRSDKKTPKGGPDGGDGGRGGHIVLRGNNQYWTLLHLKYRKHIMAEHGCSGEEQGRTGTSGKDVIVEVPLGTVAKRKETSEIIGEITRHGQKMIIALGGRGGKGNAFFAHATNRAPQYAQPGEPGSNEWIILELKILADVGIVGFPNAGKSTLLSSVSAAKPKIADYPFTTLTPKLGTVAYRDGHSFVIADIPGIVTGAASGKGLGFQFLKHIERNRVLLLLIAADQLEIAPHYEALLGELGKYNKKLLDKKRILAISKADLLDDDLKAELKKNISLEIPTVFISAVTYEGINTLKDMLWSALCSVDT